MMREVRVMHYILRYIIFQYNSKFGNYETGPVLHVTKVFIGVATVLYMLV